MYGSHINSRQDRIPVEQGEGVLTLTSQLLNVHRIIIVFFSIKYSVVLMMSVAEEHFRTKQEDQKFTEANYC